MYEVLVESKLASGRQVDLCQELDAEPEHYEIRVKNLGGVVQIKAEAANIVDALVRHSQVIEELVMTK